MKKKYVRRVLSMCVGVALLFSQTSSVLAYGDNGKALDSSPPGADRTAITCLAGEEISMRGKYEKHFRLEDGSYVAAVYDVPVHYFDEETGVWQEIDNTLQTSKDATGKNVYQNRDGLFDVSFAQSATKDGQLVTMETDEHSISWKFVQPTSISAEVQELTAVQKEDAILSSAQVIESEKQSADKTAVTKSTGRLIYDDLAGQNTDVRFTVTPLKVKEDILLESAPLQAVSYTTQLVLSKGLVPTLGEDNTVFVRDVDGKDIFRISAPYMTDALDELSQDIEVELVQKADCWELTVTPSYEWLTDETRVYPVVIDPTVHYADNNASNMWDTYIYEGATSSTAASREDLDRMYVGNRTSAGQSKCRGLIKFLTMPTIFGDITGAQLTLTTPSGTTSWKNMTLYRITQGWQSSTVAWPGPTTTVIESKAASNGKYTFDVTDAITAMYYDNETGSHYNFGFQVRYQNESAADYNSICSSEWGTDTDVNTTKPYLEITYTTEPYYQIRNAASGNYLSVPDYGGSGTVLKGETRNDRANQSWQITYEGDGLYSLTPAYRIAARMNLPDSNITNGQDVTIASNNSSTAQRWYIYPNDDGTFRFVPYAGKASNKVLQVESATSGSVSNVEISSWSSAAKQKWYIERISSTQHSDIESGRIYYLKNVSTGKYLGMTSDTNATLVQVGQQAKAQNGKQRWRITYSRGNYVLKPIIGHDDSFALNKVLEIPNSNIGTGVVPRVNSAVGSTRFRFQLREAADNTCVIMTGCTGFNTALAADTGTGVSTAYYNGTSVQKWVLEPADNPQLESISLGCNLFPDGDPLDYPFPEEFADLKLSKAAFDLFGYSSEYHADDYTINDVESLLEGKKVVHFSCHGDKKGGLQYTGLPNAVDNQGFSIIPILKNGQLDERYQLLISDVLPSNCKLVIFECCMAYIEYDPEIHDSPVDAFDVVDFAANSANAEAVVAWGHNIPEDNRIWFREFYDYLLRGKTVKEVIEIMNDQHYDADGDKVCDCIRECNLYDAKYFGNDNVRLFAQE